MPRRFWEKASHAVTSDRAGLAVLGVTALVRAVSYAPFSVDTTRNPAHWLEGLLPAPAWAIVWLFIAVACMAAIITPRLLPVAVGMTVAINTLWALSFIGITSHTIDQAGAGKSPSNQCAGLRVVSTEKGA